MSEGVEYYLDLLAALHSEEQHGVRLENPDKPDNFIMIFGNIFMRAFSSFATCLDVFAQGKNTFSTCYFVPAAVCVSLS